MSFTIRRVREEKKPSKLRRWVRLAIPVVRSALRLEEHLKESEERDVESQKREKRLKRWLATLVAIFLAVVLLIGALHVIVRLKEIALGMATVASANLPKDNHGFTNILLLGEGDNDHSGVDLTDTVMVVSLDPSRTKSAVMMSIPRDTYVLKTELMGKERINGLYRNYKNSLIRSGMEAKEASMASLTQLTKEVSALIWLPIHGVIKINFSGFEEAVDLLGGVDVDVPEDIVDREYPGPNYSYQTFSIQRGMQHLDGATALKYARSRHSTSDFSRSARQQQIIVAIGKKAQDDGIIKNISRLGEMLSLVSKNIESTFSSRELLGLAATGKSIDTSRIISMQLNDQNGLYDGLIAPGGFLYAPPREEFEGASVLLPVSIPPLPVTWKQISALTKILSTKRLLFIHPSSIVTLNAGAREGAARVLGGELYRYGFDVVKTRNLGPAGSPDSAESSIAVNPSLLTSDNEGMIARGKIASSTAAYLADLLQMPIDQNPAPLAFEQENADIAIVLGEKYRYTPLQDLVVVE